MRVTSSVSTTEPFSTHDVTLGDVDGSLFRIKIRFFSWGIMTNMGKTEGIFLNLQCDCHRVASIFIKLINQRTNVSTWLQDLTAL